MEKHAVIRTIDARHELLQSLNLELDAGLREGVVVLDGLEQVAEAPEAVGLNLRQVRRGQWRQRPRQEQLVELQVCTRARRREQLAVAGAV